MKNYSLTSHLMGARWLSDGTIAGTNGDVLKAYESDPFPSGHLEEGFRGSLADTFFAKSSDLLSKLPNLFEGQILLVRKPEEEDRNPGFNSRLYFFEKVPKPEGYSHLRAILDELGLAPRALSQAGWLRMLSGVFGTGVTEGRLPDVTWEKDHLKVEHDTVRVLSLTELPQVTWKGCFQSLYEYPAAFTMSVRCHIPDRNKVKRQLETKRRVSHALSVSTSLEVQNIESNSVLSSSEETLERILVGKETLFETSIAILVSGPDAKTEEISRDIERLVSGIGNAGVFTEGVGSLPVFRSHLPGNKTLGARKLPVLSENLCHLLPLLHDYSRSNDASSLEVRSRTEERCHLNLFSSENLNFNSFICGASGSGKSFLMNAILSASLVDDPRTRLCIFDVGGSYRKIVQSRGGKSTKLSHEEAYALLATFLRLYPVSSKGFYRAFVETLCGSGSHITHSHRVAIDDLLRGQTGRPLVISEIIESASKRSEGFYQDIAHWLKPHVGLDRVKERPDLITLIRAPVSAFDFKELDSDPVLQKVTILLLSELLWRDLMEGTYSRTLVVFDEVWRFFAHSKSFLEEMYRTLRKYKAGIVSITQNLADYGEEAFSKMLFTNSFTKIFLQNGATADFLTGTFDLPESDVQRALSVASRKPIYSEFFVLTPVLSQIYRLYPSQEFYDLANTEHISASSTSPASETPN